MEKVFLIRHAETELNAELRYQGISDGELTPKGVWQAQCLAKRLKTEPIAAIYSSALRRAHQTAEIIAEQHQIGVVALSELNELNFGEWEGLTAKEIEDNYPGIFKKWMMGNPDTQIPGGELRALLQQRIEKAINQLLAQHSNQTIAIVTHGGPIKVILSKILGGNPDLFWKIRSDNASLNIIEFHEDGSIICLLNDTCHWRICDLPR